jgi:hypothetical protein
MKFNSIQLVARLLLCAAATHGLADPASSGSSDPEFAKVPFEQWLADSQPSPLKLTIRVFPAQLSVHQRLLARVDVTLDGAQLAPLRGQGEMVILFQLNDRENAAWQDHGSIDLQKMEEGVKGSNIVYSEYIFVLPGDYRISIAAYNTATRQHAVRKDKLHVPALKNDPLPELWRDLPAVEFRPVAEPPDAWYLPQVKGRLHLSLVDTKAPRIDVLVNLTPSERLSASLRAQDRNMGTLLPALKILSQGDLGHASFNLALLDLTRRRVGFRQEQAIEVNWPGIKEFLADAQPGTIDIKSLGERQHKARFFVTEVARRVQDLQSRILIVLSSSVAFESGEDLRPIRLETPSTCRVYYFRFHSGPSRPLTFLPDGRGSRRMGMPSRRPENSPDRPFSAEMPDQLASTLKPLSPKVFDVLNPEQFRKALASMLAELSHTASAAR